MDCVEGMKQLPDNFVDLVVTSPPYNVGKDYEKFLSESEYFEFLNDVFVEIRRVLKRDGRFCWNVPYQMYTKRMPHTISQWYLSVKALMSAGLKLRDNITWNQLNSGNNTAWGSYCSASSPWLRHITEAIIVGYKDVWKKETKGQSSITKSEFLKYTSDRWDMICARRNGHTAPFPLELPLRCIKLFSYTTDLVLDPFMGSGTTALACKELNRKYIGFELNPEYLKMAKDRVNNRAVLWNWI